MKIKSISRLKLDSAEPVYDVIDSGSNHNFIIRGQSCNLVSHNCNHGTFSLSDRNFYYIPEGGKVVIDYGSDAAHALGAQVFVGFCDELNFAKAGVKDVSKAKEHMMDLYNTISARVKGTFRMNGEVYGKIFAVSSKRSDSDFMEMYMQRQIEAGAGTHMYIADRPQWEVLPKSMFSDKTFTIAVGDKHKRGFVVSEGQDFPEALEELKNQGYTLLHPPIDMRPEFIADFDIALRDLAGISVPGTLSYITQEQVEQCICNRKNPFYQDILEIGTNDTLTIEEFFHIDEIEKRHMNMPMFIHMDLSLNDDKTGISGVCVCGSKDIKGADGKVIAMPVFAHIFSLSLQAPRGANIAYNKILSFIVWLRRQGFNIAGISRDQFQSEYLAQLLEAEGFGKVPKLSLDRTPDGYNALRSVLSEQRIDLLHVDLLENELIHLQRDSFSGKIDHRIGESKDVSDSLAGAVWNAILTNPGVPVPTKDLLRSAAMINTGRTMSPQTALNNIFFPGYKKY